MIYFTILNIFILFIFTQDRDAYLYELNQRVYRDSIIAKKNGDWYDSNLYQFEIKFPKIIKTPDIPPFIEKYNLPILTFIDSLSRNANNEYIYSNFENRWVENKIKNDTTISIIKYHYQIIDYNPIVYHQLKRETNSYYDSSYFSLRRFASDLFNCFLGLKGYMHSYPFKYKAFKLMYQADYILKIKINEIDSVQKLHYSKNKGFVPNEYTYQANATVLDTLKGKVFQNCYNSLPINNNSEICFSYSAAPYTNEYSQVKVHSSILNKDKNLRLQKGQELIVFLSYGNYLFDNNYDYFYLNLISALPISHNEVKDINKIWSNDTSIQYQKWKTIFNDKKDSILTGNISK